MHMCAMHVNYLLNYLLHLYMHHTWCISVECQTPVIFVVDVNLESLSFPVTLYKLFWSCANVHVHVSPPLPPSKQPSPSPTPTPVSSHQHTTLPPSGLSSTSSSVLSSPSSCSTLFVANFEVQHTEEEVADLFRK